MLPTITAAVGRSPLVLQADAAQGRLAFAVWRHTRGGWVVARDLGTTSAADYPGLGELLGLGSTRQTVVTAVPTGRRPSALAVSVSTAPSDTTPTPATADTSSDAAKNRPRSSRHQPSAAAAITVAAVGLAAVFLVGGLRRYSDRIARRRPGH